MQKKNIVQKREQDALFSLACNFFVQGQYRQAKIIYDGLKALMPEEEKFARAAQECKNRFNFVKK